jgi:hypothetical protein
MCDNVNQSFGTRLKLQEDEVAEAVANAGYAHMGTACDNDWGQCVTNHLFFRGYKVLSLGAGDTVKAIASAGAAYGGVICDEDWGHNVVGHLRDHGYRVVKF